MVDEYPGKANNKKVEMMEIATTIEQMRLIRERIRMHNTVGSSVGFVPTMGALHRGHETLIRRAAECCDTTIVSIFVNPMQFGPTEDFQRYPRPFQLDCDRAAAAGCDIVFAPSAEQMYPKGFATDVSVGGITERFEGSIRPGHFSGVATVVLKLFHIVEPTIAFFGQKDAQQVVVIKKMVRELDYRTTIEVVATVREPDGLALSSRNVYLTERERRAAPLINKGLETASKLFCAGERSCLLLLKAICEVYKKTNLFTPDYLDIVDPHTLESLSIVEQSAVILTACRTVESKTRLLDNIVLGGSL
ncbi:MAG: pantoate--beta-alanine ligase [Chitinivibrionales bacterium]|nr:pantoate--beta-alanine ligase [Chitinivibrionales bacterium]